MENKLTEAQKKAQKKWEQENKEKRAFIRDKSAAKRFILKKATNEDLDVVEEWLKEAKKSKENS